eukprot:SAG31_NODE_3791_length_3878_cov_2.272823_2_plen_277_part_00
MHRCHGRVLNTDNICVSGESIDHGSSRFNPIFDPAFVAIPTIDRRGRYAAGQQATAVLFGLEKLADCFDAMHLESKQPTRPAAPTRHAELLSTAFSAHYEIMRRVAVVSRLGFARSLWTAERLEAFGGQTSVDALAASTWSLLRRSAVGLHQFYSELGAGLCEAWASDPNTILASSELATAFMLCQQQKEEFTTLYSRWLAVARDLEGNDWLEGIRGTILRQTVPVDMAEAPCQVWQAIEQRDDWQPLREFVANIAEPNAKINKDSRHPCTDGSSF